MLEMHALKDQGLAFSHSEPFGAQSYKSPTPNIAILGFQTAREVRSEIDADTRNIWILQFDSGPTGKDEAQSDARL